MVSSKSARAPGYPFLSSSGICQLGASLAFASALLSLTACNSPEEKKPAPAASAPAPATPMPRMAPTLSVDDLGPLVRGERVALLVGKGQISPEAQSLVERALQPEAEFLHGKLEVNVSRKAEPLVLAHFIEGLTRAGAETVTVKTETRSDFPSSLVFVGKKRVEAQKGCVLMTAVTDDRGTAVWKKSGGTARKRARGMSGPDLTMTGETLLSMSQSCKSELLVVGAAPGIDFGLTYDLAASAVALAKLGVTQLYLPTDKLVPGHAL